MEALPPDRISEPDRIPEHDSNPAPAESRPTHRRFLIAMLVYAGLAILATVRLDGRPRLVVWIFLGLFAVKTLLLVLKQRAS
jgi:hypothetical protein